MALETLWHLRYILRNFAALESFTLVFYEKAAHLPILPVRVVRIRQSPCDLWSCRCLKGLHAYGSARMRGRRSERCMGNEPANPTSLRNGGDLCSDSTWNNAHSLERRRQTQYPKRDCLRNYDHCRLPPCHPLKFYSHMSFVTEWAGVGFLRDNTKFVIFFSCEILMENAGG